MRQMGQQPQQLLQSALAAARRGRANVRSQMGPFMSVKNPAKTCAVIISIFVTTPIWFFLIYKIMVAVNASELMWFLFWVYVPASLIARSLAEIGSKE